VLAADFRAEALANIAIDPSIMIGDQNGSPEYRANLVMVMARRAVQGMGTITVCK
jgi:carbon-monoxide dehydrogenase medium subunit